MTARNDFVLLPLACRIPIFFYSFPLYVYSFYYLCISTYRLKYLFTLLKVLTILLCETEFIAEVYL